MSQAFSKTKEDFKISWHLLKLNWKPFVGTELFAVFALSIMLFTFFILDALFRLYSHSSGSFTDFSRNRIQITFMGIIFIMLFFNTFLTCQFGLAYDIISSGDMFAEFKRSFTYFRRYWFHYLILTYLIGWTQLLFEPRSLMFLSRLLPITPRFGQNPPRFINIDIYMITMQNIVILIIYFISFVLFINTLPSITAQGRFKQSMRENFQILFDSPKQMILTWGLFFLIFNFPVLVVNIVNLVVFDILGGSMLFFIINILSIVTFLLGILLGAPMMTLIATRVYNSYDLDNIAENSNNEQI
jgi:hypothetical protein